MKKLLNTAGCFNFYIKGKRHCMIFPPLIMLFRLLIDVALVAVVMYVYWSFFIYDEALIDYKILGMRLGIVATLPSCYLTLLALHFREKVKNRPKDIARLKIVRKLYEDMNMPDKAVHCKKEINALISSPKVDHGYYVSLAGFAALVDFFTPMIVLSCLIIPTYTGMAAKAYSFGYLIGLLLDSSVFLCVKHAVKNYGIFCGMKIFIKMEMSKYNKE